MAVCYTLMGIELWGSKSIGEHTQRQKESMKSKRKVIKVNFFIIYYNFIYLFVFFLQGLNNTEYGDILPLKLCISKKSIQIS